MLSKPRLPSSSLALFALLLAGAGTLGVADPAAAARARRMTVSGTVTNMDDQPVAGARVSLHEIGTGGEIEAADTGKSGRFQIEWRGEPGTYRLRIEAEGYGTVENEASLAARGGNDVAVQLASESALGRQEAVDAYNAGVTAAQEGNVELALEKLDQAVAADPTLPESYIARAQILLESDRPEEAAEQAELYLEKRPEDENARRLAYEAYRRSKDEEGMARQAASLAQTDAAPTVAADVYNLGVEAYRSGDRDTALAKFARALELHPGLLQAHLATASIRFDQERYPDALEHLESVLDRDPKRLEALEMRFLAFEAMGSPDAEEALSAWAAAAPDAALAKLAEWAGEDFEADRLESAEQNLLRLLALRPDRPETHHLLGLVYASSGDPDKAKRHLGRFLEIAPDHPEAASARAMIEAL